MLDRLGAATQVDVEQDGQVVVRKRVVGIGLERAPIGVLGFLELPGLAQQDSKLVVRDRVLGIDRERAVERGSRVARPILVPVDDREIHLRSRISGIVARQQTELALRAQPIRRAHRR